MVISGCFLSIIGLRLAHFFYEFPAIPSVLSVTFWRDTIAFSLVAVVGFTLMVIGIVRLLNTIKMVLDNKNKRFSIDKFGLPSG